MAIRGFGEARIKDVRDFEARNSIHLPNDYLDFLLTYNGGIVAPTEGNEIFINGLDTIANMDVLFGVKTKDPELDVQLWLDDYRSDMPEDSVIIGDTHQHGLIVLLCSSEEPGVYYWDHAYTFPDSNDESNTYYIADTFTNFARGLLSSI